MPVLSKGYSSWGEAAPPESSSNSLKQSVKGRVDDPDSGCSDGPTPLKTQKIHPQLRKECANFPQYCGNMAVFKRASI